MKDIKTYILETKGDPIDDQWLNDERPVMTKDGRQVIVTEIDLKEVPNIIKGKVKMKNELYDYVYVANMAFHDFYNSSIINEEYLAKFIKDYIDDEDGYPEVAFSRFYIDTVKKGIPIDWEEML